MTLCWLLRHVFAVARRRTCVISVCGRPVLARYTILFCVCCGKQKLGGVT